MTPSAWAAPAPEPVQVGEVAAEGRRAGGGDGRSRSVGTNEAQDFVAGSDEFGNYN